ncbi:MAG: hypothetical protein RL885_12070 [Planctomycetota bacterium]
MSSNRLFRVLALCMALAATGEAIAQPGDVERRRVEGVPEDQPRIPEGFSLPKGVATTMLPPHMRSASGRPAIVLTGYWPPTNESVRRFSPSPTQNPQGWIGSDWEGRGYDVYAYFPEFTPPNCVACGKGDGDLEVDYQDTSQDFWPIMGGHDPIAVITFSRGRIDTSWEVELNQYNRLTWLNDYLAPTQPTPRPPDADVPQNHLRQSALPTFDIVNAVNNANLGVNAFLCVSGDGGGFLSEFMAYHGVWYQALHDSPALPDWCIAGGHIHVGSRIDWMTARLAVEVTLRTVITYVDSVIAQNVCQADLGFAGPGAAGLAVCGQALTTGGRADIALFDAPPFAPAVLAVGPTFNPRPFVGGVLVPSPVTLTVPAIADADGRVLVKGLLGGGGPFSAYAQCVYLDGSLPQRVGLTNAVRVDFLQ